MSSLLGTTLGGRYRLESRIGSGGMSTVYRAHDETLERWVAIKLMNREITTDSDQLERFRREAKAVAKLSHPNIVHVIDAGEDEGRPYIVFEYIEGETLKDRIRRLGRLPIPEAVAYCIEIARALGAAHASHVVHRDVKPQNVLLDHEGTAKVTDFGIARTLEEDGLTDDGRVLGTTDYVSPEQALGQPVTGQSDLYSLGIALYEMLTGNLPFSGETQVAVAMKHVREPLPDVRRLRPEVSATLATVVETATAKDVNERYADDSEMITDLESVLALETSRAGTADDGQVTAVLQSLPPSTRGRVPLAVRHRGTVLAFVVVGVVLVAGAVIGLTLGASANHRHSGHHHAAPGPGTSVVAICSGCAHAYNPDGQGGTAQNNSAAPLAVDGKVNTGWTTENYYSDALNKPGVGIYVVAKSAVAATKLVVDTATPGWEGSIYATERAPSPTNFQASGWVRLASTTNATPAETFKLASGSHRYKYYLVWITQLPSGASNASINEIKLYS
jgi:serine/threonine-protein kinase